MRACRMDHAASFLSSLPPTCPQGVTSFRRLGRGGFHSNGEFSANRHSIAYSNFRDCIAPSTRGLRRSGLPFRAPLILSTKEAFPPSVLLHCPSQLRLSFPLLPTKSYPLLLVGRSVGPPDGESERAKTENVLGRSRSRRLGCIRKMAA